MSLEKTPLNFEEIEAGINFEEGKVGTFGSGVHASAEPIENKQQTQEQLYKNLDKEQMKRFGGFVTKRLEEIKKVA